MGGVCDAVWWVVCVCVRLCGGWVVCVRLCGGWCLCGCVSVDVRTREWLYITCPVKQKGLYQIK